MALVYFGVTASQHEIAHRLGHIPGAGIPAPNIIRLSQYGVDVEYAAGGVLGDLSRAIDDGTVVIAFVRTGELPHWEEDVPHAVVVVAVDIDTVYLDDPAFENAPIPVTVGDFMLAWDEFGNQWAQISARQTQAKSVGD